VAPTTEKKRRAEKLDRAENATDAATEALARVQADGEKKKKGSQAGRGPHVGGVLFRSGKNVRKGTERGEKRGAMNKGGGGKLPQRPLVLSVNPRKSSGSKKKSLLGGGRAPLTNGPQPTVKTKNQEQIFRKKSSSKNRILRYQGGKDLYKGNNQYLHLYHLTRVSLEPSKEGR